MNETKRLKTLISVMAVMVGIILIAIFSGDSKKKQYSEQIVDMVVKAYTAEEATLIYVGRPTCSYCQLLDPNLESLATTYLFGYIYVNTDELTDDAYYEIIDLLDPDVEEFGTPYLAVVGNNTKMNEYPGYGEKADIFAFLQENGIIAEDAEYKEILHYVDYSEYEQIIASSDQQLVLIVATGCTYCTQAKPILEGLSKEYNITIHTVNYSNLTATEASSLFTSMDYLADDWGTPLLMVVKDGVVLDAENGFLNQASYESFLQANGFIN